MLNSKFEKCLINVCKPELDAKFYYVQYGRVEVGYQASKTLKKLSQASIFLFLTAIHAVHVNAWKTPSLDILQLQFCERPIF